MSGYQVLATLHDYNNPGQKGSQKMITEMNEIYNYPEYKSFAKSKIYDNGRTRGVKIKIFCEDLNCVRDQIVFLTLNITTLLEDTAKKIDLFKINIPEIKIVLTKKL